MSKSAGDKHKAHKGRGAVSNPHNRYSGFSREDFDDGWDTLAEPLVPLKTSLLVDSSKTVISYNDSPDVPFDRTINPYRGCEHGCIYCYARPTHAWLGHSPGLDFESLLYYKPDAVDCLRKELAAKSYRCATIGIGGITDAYQPVERQIGLTRSLIKLLSDCRHPLTIVTKSSLVERDSDLLAELASQKLATVCISLTTLDASLARKLEPRAAAPKRRLQTIQRLSSAGIPVTVLVSPLIPVLTDPEIEQLLEAARNAGASSARSVLLRLPLEVAPLFQQWLQTHYPNQSDRVLNRVRDTRGGELYRSDFSQRMTGTGEYAELLAKRFQLAIKKLGFGDPAELDCSQFRKPGKDDRQMSLL